MALKNVLGSSLSSKAFNDFKINGLLVAGNSYEEKVKNLAKDMDSLIVNEDLFIQLSKNALATNLLHFDINTIVQKWENLLKKAITLRFGS